MTTSSYESLSHSKWDGKYHVVFIPKGRKKALEGVSHVLDPSEGSSKLIPINEESDHEIVHALRLGEAQRAADEPFDPGP